MKHVLNLIKIVLISFGLSILQAIPVSIIMFNSDNTISTIASLVVASVAAFIYYKNKFLFKNIKLDILYYIAGFVVFSFVSMATIGLIFNISESSENQKLIESLFAVSKVPIFIGAVIVAPLVEEFIFRNLFFKWYFNLANKGNEITDMKKGIGLLIFTSIIFALLHETSVFSSFLIYATMGFGLGFVRFKSQKLEYSVIVHMVWNFITIIIMLLSK